MYFRTIIIALTAFVSVGYTKVLPLPSYIKRCSSSAADFEECAVRNGREAIPTLIKGDKKYNVPVLTPLKIPLITVNSGPDFSLNLIDASLSGFESFDLQKIKFDLEKRTIFAKISFKKIELIGQYDVNGRILVLPIQGKGNINITADDVGCEYSTKYILEKIDGEEFAKVTNGTAKIDTKRAYFHLTNLFNGNKELGEQTNKVLNEDWEQVIDTIKPAMGETLIKIANSIINGFASRVPFKEFFID